MKNIAKYIVAFGFAFLLAGGLKADASTYRHSVGVRLGNHFAADYKFYVSNHSAFDFAFGLVNPFSPQYQFLLFSGAYDFHFGTGVSGLSPYIGGGLSLGTRFGDLDVALRDRVDFFLSLDIPVGIEYSVRRKPVAFFLEWNPKVQLVNDIRFIPHSASIGVRFVFPRLR